ncbi:aspartic peptidase domain-containing protein [Lipomyces doorenjongii]
MRPFLLALAVLAHIAFSFAHVPFYGDNATSSGIVAKVPIYRRGGRVYNPEWISNMSRFNEVLKSSLKRYSRSKRELHGNQVVRKAISLSEKLAAIGEDGSWYANVELGNPGQKVEFDIDMTSSDFWVESTTSVRGTRFEARNSQSYVSKDRLGFEDCVESLDSLVFGDKKFNVEFAHCNPPRASLRTLDPSGSIMGLAHSSLSQTSLPHFFENAKEKRKLADSIFAIEFKNDFSGVLSFGGLARYHDEPLFAPVKCTGFWQVLFKTVLLNGNLIQSNILGTIDMTSPFVLAPAEDVRMIYNAISGSEPLGNGFWSYPCSENPKIHLEYAGWWFPFKDSSLGKVKEYSDYCVGPLVEADLDGRWIIGEPFLRNVVTVFDFGRNSVGIRSL